jgi:hypothetical protein
MSENDNMCPFDWGSTHISFIHCTSTSRGVQQLNPTGAIHSFPVSRTVLQWSFWFWPSLRLTFASTLIESCAPPTRCLGSGMAQICATLVLPFFLLISFFPARTWWHTTAVAGAVVIPSVFLISLLRRHNLRDALKPCAVLGHPRLVAYLHPQFLPTTWLFPSDHDFCCRDGPKCSTIGNSSCGRNTYSASHLRNCSSIARLLVRKHLFTPSIKP